MGFLLQPLAAGLSDFNSTPARGTSCVSISSRRRNISFIVILSGARAPPTSGRDLRVKRPTRLSGAKRCKQPLASGNDRTQARDRNPCSLSLSCSVYLLHGYGYAVCHRPHCLARCCLCLSSPRVLPAPLSVPLRPCPQGTDNDNGEPGNHFLLHLHLWHLADAFIQSDLQ